MESSNAKENTPFALHVGGPMTSAADLTCRAHCVLEKEEQTIDSFMKGAVRCRVSIPKAEVAGCEVLKYTLTTRTQVRPSRENDATRRTRLTKSGVRFLPPLRPLPLQNMPILVQAKASLVRSDTCRISVQVRSNLGNTGDLADLLVVVVIPSTLSGDGVRITRGDHGVYDPLKRLLTWKHGRLPHGESCLVSAEAPLAAVAAELLHDHPFEADAVEKRLRCPVLVRCTATGDQVSDMTLTAAALDDVPATVVPRLTRSYRLVHRVPGEEEGA